MRLSLARCSAPSSHKGSLFVPLIFLQLAGRRAAGPLRSDPPKPTGCVSRRPVAATGSYKHEQHHFQHELYEVQDLVADRPLNHLDHGRRV